MSIHRNLLFAVAATIGLYAFRAPAVAVEPVPPDFQREIQPLLAAHCVKCHGPEKQKGGLRLDQKAAAFKGGDSEEPAVVPKQSGQSRLLQLVMSKVDGERMPPTGERLTDAQIALLKRWIDAGAEWPESDAGTDKSQPAEMRVTDADRQHWSFLPLCRALEPTVNNTAWPRTPVDRFVLHAQELKGLAPSPAADLRTLIRRVYFDVLGLPPRLTEEGGKWKEELLGVEIDPATFLLQPSAWESLIDKLLDSPHYGERWARHWLDVARYADSNGQEADDDRLNAYHYRDFVIRAMNDDMAFDQFVRWQIAGDEFDPDNPSAVSATGFLTAGHNTRRVLELMEEERLRNRYNELDDMLATTGSAMLGLTLACARCHDHKYDPIPTRDYYRLLSAYHSGDRAEVPLVPRSAVADHQQKVAAWTKQADAARKELNDWLEAQKKPHTEELRNAKIAALPVDEQDKETLRDAGQKNSSAVKALQKKHEKVLTISDEEYRARLSPEQRTRWDELAGVVKRLEAAEPKPLPTAYAMADFGSEPVETWLFNRGEFLSKREPVSLGFLSVLTRDRTPEQYFADARAERPLAGSTYQRKALALWMTDLDHGAGALLARVIVNRVWQHHFGHGLVRTVNDFGSRGELPSHPELLEWLAHELVAGGWKLKQLHRLILTSEVYRQSAAHDAAKAKIDPENRLLWRRPLTRLESEVLRDAMLAVSGSLNLQMHGPAFKPPIAEEAMQARNLKSPYPKNAADEPATRRRTVYMFHKRVIQYPLMQAFDGPDATASCGERNRTTVATQALAILNDGFVRRRAEDFADRLLAASQNTHGQVRQSYEFAFARAPSDRELKAAVTFIESQLAVRQSRGPDALDRNRRLALADYCQALFGLNEFLYVE